MTNEQNALICRRLCGYEVQVSPAGKHYIVTDEGTRALPDFEENEDECISTADTLCRSRNGSWSMGRDSFIGIFGKLYLNGYGITEYRSTPCSALAHCLLQIAEGEE